MSAQRLLQVSIHPITIYSQEFLTSSSANGGFVVRLQNFAVMGARVAVSQLCKVAVLLILT